MNEVPPYSASSVEVVRLPEGETEPDEIAVEEPLEIRVAGRPIAVTMRTPGHDEELAVGFLRSEGIPAVSAGPTADLAANVIDVEVDGEVDFERLARNFYTSSSCGVCGKGALEAVAVEAPPVESDLVASAELVAGLPDRLREAQPTFAATGGLHATGLFSAEGALLVDADEGEIALERHRFRRAQEPARLFGQDFLLARNQRDLLLALDANDAVINLPRQ